ncbi:MAG: pantoate--beta-alanine ligase [Chlorobia bacterium]|nr:pantoate--beta-alanine ligase [Fimbriimonadaceae bacterium]
MGAFHEGHLHLMRRAREENDTVVVSIFVNPLQFGPNEDFEKYPRDLASDAAMAETVGVDIVFTPSVVQVYKNQPTTTIQVPLVGDLWEGSHRPGHFAGVATVVVKLFNMVQPRTAYFGRKDFQQCAVVRRMVEDLNMSVNLSIEPTFRESDGLAMSSRNRYLSTDERSIAPELFEALNSDAEAIRNGVPIPGILQSRQELLGNLGFVVDYYAYVDDLTLEPLTALVDCSTLICAATLGSTRLIDNVQVG